MDILVLNAGSSTLKFQLIRTDAERMAAQADEHLARGVVERIGGEAILTLSTGDAERRRSTRPLQDHRAAVEAIIGWLVDDASGVPIGSIGEISAVGHRVVHGGERFSESVEIGEEVERGIEEMIELAPLHNPHNLRGIRAARAALGRGVPQVAVFDTAFHHTLPPRSYLYAIPYSYYRRYGVRRYGFHGTSHRYVAWRYRQLTGRARDRTNLITLHLGNGASVCAIRNGDSIDTSMGFTPLEGLVMGTRSGDVDPAVLDYLAGKEGMTGPEAEAMLYKQSGLLGISGLTHDMRELIAEASEHDDRRARLAIEIFCYRARKYMGAYLAALGGADAVVFAGGVGENAPTIRAQILEGMEWAGLELDGAANRSTTGGAEGRISPADAAPEVWVIPTDEELLIARDTYRVVKG